MNHFRHVSSLQEDFAALGLIKQKQQLPGFPKEVPTKDLKESNSNSIDLDEQAQYDEVDLDAIIEDENLDLDSLEEDLKKDLSTAQETDLKESEEPLEEDEIDEVKLVRQRLKRSKPGDRAKARQDYKKNRSKILRARKKRNAKSAVKLRRAKLQKLKGNRSAGSRRRFSLAADSGEISNLVESLQNVELKGGNLHEVLQNAFVNLDRAASLLCQKYALIEAEMQHGMPVEHPDSHYGEDGEDNVKEGGKTGDATDSASDAPAGNVKHGDDHPDHKLAKGNVRFECDDDDMDDEEEDSDDDMEESMSVEMAGLRFEASDAMDKLKTHTISPAEAGIILKDMVTYLGGAMKSYLDLAKSVSDRAYAGQQMPMGVDQSVQDNVDQAGHDYIGKDQPESANGNPEVVDRGRMGESSALMSEKDQKVFLKAMSDMKHSGRYMAAGDKKTIMRLDAMLKEIKKLLAA